MTLENSRKRIDEIDDDIINLLNERTKVVIEIGKKKEKTGDEVFAPARECAVYEKIDKVNKGPLPNDAVKIIYREIMSASISLEKDVKIAYLGPEASFTNLAALSKFGNSVSYVACESISDVFLEVEKGNADHGVIPIENSTEGAVRHSLDMFVDSELKICSEILFDVHHFLMSNSSMNQIKRIYSNPQVFAQCRNWLKKYMAQVELIDTSSTTRAAERAAQEDGAAAIASKLASVIYNLNILAESIEDSAHNMTRFLVVGKKISEATGNDKTSIVCSVKDKVGALYDTLKPIYEKNINMTKIESRPSKRKAWDYYVFIDVEGHIDDENIKETLIAMEDHVRFIKVLGSYPRMKVE